MPERNPPPTLESRRLMQNFITKNTDPELLTINITEIEQKQAEHRKELDVANKAKQQPEEDWLAELDELNRRLTNQMTVSEAKSYSDAQEALHKDAVRTIEKEVAYLKELLETPGLSRCLPLRGGRTPVNGDKCDVCLFNRKIEAVQIKLSQAKQKQQTSIRLCGSIVTSAKELEAYRPRWEELKKREKAISTARRQIRDHVVLDTRQSSGDHTTRGGFHFTKD